MLKDMIKDIMHNPDYMEVCHEVDNWNKIRQHSVIVYIIIIIIINYNNTNAIVNTLYASIIRTYDVFAIKFLNIIENCFPTHSKCFHILFIIVFFLPLSLSPPLKSDIQ